MPYLGDVHGISLAHYYVSVPSLHKEFTDSLSIYICDFFLTDHLFPMGIKDLMHRLEDIVERWYELGVQLDVPISKLNEIRCNNSSDVYQCKLLMLQEWQRRPTLKPSWCTLVDALRNMKENAIVKRLSQQFGKLCWD